MNATLEVALSPISFAGDSSSLVEMIDQKEFACSLVLKPLIVLAW